MYNTNIQSNLACDEIPCIHKVKRGIGRTLHGARYMCSKVLYSIHYTVPVDYYIIEGIHYTVYIYVKS